MTSSFRADSTTGEQGGPPSLDPRLLEFVRQGLDETTDSPPDGEMELSASDFELQARLSRVLAKARPARNEAWVGEDGTLPPFNIDRFQIREFLGEGGFGVVFRAYDPQLDKEIALKVLRPDLMFLPEVRERFLREAQTAAQLDHPGIVVTHEVSDGQAIAFIASSLCKGPTLADWLADHPAPLSPPIVARLIASLADAVHHAHSRGVLHRDLKPTNVLLQPDDLAVAEFPFRPLLTDFGLAKRLDAVGVATQTGTIMGSVHYMSPEQASGQWRDVGIASDIFSLGVILYEVLTGTRPFTGDNQEQIKHRIISDTPIEPGKLRPPIPRGLELITLKCLAKAPGDRYDSAKALADDLRNFLHHRPLVVRPAGVAQRFQLWCRRHPAVAALSTVLGVSVIASFVVIMRARNDAEEMLAVARQVVSKSYIRMADRWLLNEPNAQDIRLEFLANALQFYREVAKKYPDDEESRYDLSEALHRYANVLKTIGRMDEAIECRSECLSIAGELAREYPGKQGYRYDRFVNLMTLAGELGRQGRNDQRLESLEEARSVINQLCSESPDDEEFQDGYAALCGTLAQVYQERNDDVRAIATWQEAAEISTRLAAANPSKPLLIKHAAEAYSALGNRFAKRNDLDRAQKYAKRAIAIVDDLHQRCPDERWCDELDASESCNFANWLLDSSRHSEAIPILTRWIKALDQLTEWNPKTSLYRGQRADAYAKLGQSHYRLGERDLSRQAYRKSLDDWYYLMTVEPVVAEAQGMYHRVKSSCPFPELREHPSLLQPGTVTAESEKASDR